MKRSKLAVAVAAATAMSVVMAVPALADDGVGERLEDQAERVEEFYDDHGYTRHTNHYHSGIGRCDADPDG